MQILFEHKSQTSPKISIILLDWSCRESFHTLHYLNNQMVSREEYEIIWIEYYTRHSPEIEAWLKECERLGKPPIVDKWIIMGMPGNVYYHKHLMYNIGIVASKGWIVTFCDSDVIVKPTFVDAIIKSFEKDSNIVLHMDEARNTDKRFYPFNYPAIEDVIGKGCLNWKDGKTTGLSDTEDFIHTVNYGSCMSALSEDLINIGGADEHIDYLGHICGAYDMTFRLVNAGKKEVWHEREFLYHTWHPGTEGKKNYLGPHDGYNISTTALDTRRTGRAMPLVENPAIWMLRLKQDGILYEPLLLQAIPEEEIKEWTIERVEKYRKSFWKLGNFVNQPVVKLRLAITFFKMLIRQFHMKATKFSRQPKSIKDILKKVYKSYNFLKNMSQYNTYIMERCDNCLKYLASNNIKEFAVYGAGDIAEVLYKLTLDAPIKINAIYDSIEGKNFFKFNVMPIEAIKNYRGKVVVTTLVEVADKIEILKKIGVEEKRIVVFSENFG